MTRPAIAVIPSVPDLERAVEEGGGRVGDLEEADAIIWADPRRADRLQEVLTKSPARWVQLPFAGIERFLESGVIDGERIWTCTKGIYGPACAELALALILAAARGIDHRVRQRKWMPRREISSMSSGQSAAPRRVAGTTAVIVGTGGIGQALAKMLEPLEVRVIGVNRSGQTAEGIDRVVSISHLDEVLSEADWVVLAAPLTSETHHLMDANRLSLMRPDAWLVNVARGGLVDTYALVEALREGSVGGAALDVTEPEPLPDDHALWQFDNVIVTSHTANTAAMALPDLSALVERNVRRFAKGEALEGVIDPNLGY